jgi:hypothetical protein
MFGAIGAATATNASTATIAEPVGCTFIDTRGASTLFAIFRVAALDTGSADTFAVSVAGLAGGAAIDTAIAAAGHALRDDALIDAIRAVADMAGRAVIDAGITDTFLAGGTIHALAAIAPFTLLTLGFTGPVPAL